MTLAILTFIQFLVIVLVSPLMVGMIRKGKAAFQNRTGPSIILPYWSLFSLMRKEMTITKRSSWVFRMVPAAVLGTALILAFVVPTIAIVNIGLDNVFFVGGLLALGAVFLVLGGMDTASTFGNMGSSREMTLVSLMEPAIFLVFAGLSTVTGAWSLGGIVQGFVLNPETLIFAALSLLALLLIILAENARYPVDNPATHLELTMVHEAMVLEYSGPYLALLEYASMIKLTALLVFFLNILIPTPLAALPLTGAGLVIACAAFLLKLILGAFIIAFIESTVVKMRFYRMQEYMSLAFLLALGGVALALFSF